MKKLLLLLSLLSSQVFAGLISVTNDGFEEPQLTGGSQTWTIALPNGWVDIPNGQAGLAFGATIIHDPTEARSGNQYLHFQVPNLFENIRIVQNFTETLTLGNTYSASVWLGFRGNQSIQTGSIRLVAGGSTLITETLTQAGGTTEKTWHKLTVNYTPTATDLMLGQDLALELFRSNAGFSADFDDVSFISRSTNSTISEPRTLWLFILAFISFLLVKQTRIKS